MRNKVRSHWCLVEQDVKCTRRGNYYHLYAATYRTRLEDLICADLAPLKSYKLEFHSPQRK